MAVIELTKKIDPGASADISLTLNFDARSKSRMRATLDDGNDVAIILPRGNRLRPGDLLGSVDGLVVVVKAAAEEVSMVKTDDQLLLARACYHLGNRHVALQILPSELRYLHDHVLDDMVRKLGLEVTVTDLPFEPEAGAYGDHAHVHGDHHGHDH